jgi:hypothetical protein
MKGTVLYGPRDVRYEEREDPRIIEATDAIIRLAATCVRIGPMAVSRRAAPRRADADGA